jgi:hypothetical protein
MFHSRNGFNLVSRAPNDKLAFGTNFHKALHSFYAGKRDNIDNVITAAMMGIEDPSMMRTMLTGYVSEVLPYDLETYQVLDIEQSFKIPLHEFIGVEVDDELILDANGEEIVVCGSIDMTALDVAEGTIWGFEHKTCKSFRSNNISIMMDEQPRTYDIAMMRYVDKYNLDHGTNYKYGGIIMNFVKKLKRDFQYSRVYCIYSDEDRAAFQSCMLGWANDIMNDTYCEVSTPTPGFMTCAMCDFTALCDHVGYRTPVLENLLEEFEEEVEVRKIDHLDEKEAEYGYGDE